MENQEVKTPPSHADVFNKQNKNERILNREPVIAATEEKKPEEVTTASPEEKKPDRQDPQVKHEEKVKVSAEDLTDEELEELFSKRAGKRVSLKGQEPEKVLTAEEKVELEKAEKAESLAWAVTHNKLDKDLYDKALVDKSKTKRDIALSLFTAEAKADDKDLTDEECLQMFSDYYAEDEEDTSWKRKRRLAEMNTVADNYLAQYNSIDSITEDYRTFKTTAEKQESYSKSIKAIAKEIPAELSFKIPFTGVDGKAVEVEYKVPVDPKVIEKLYKEFTSPALYDVFGSAKAEAISAEMNYHVKARMLDKMIPVLMEQHAAKVEEDIMVKLKNARNPQQSIIGAPQQQSTTQKTLPSHEDVMKRMK